MKAILFAILLMTTPQAFAFSSSLNGAFSGAINATEKWYQGNSKYIQEFSINISADKNLMSIDIRSSYPIYVWRSEKHNNLNGTGLSVASATLNKDGTFAKTEDYLGYNHFIKGYIKASSIYFTKKVTHISTGKLVSDNSIKLTENEAHHLFLEINSKVTDLSDLTNIHYYSGSLLRN